MWPQGDEAIIFATSRTGTMKIMANLTNLAVWRAQGIIASDDELRRAWLQIADT